MKNIMITDMYWEKSAWTLHIHGTHVRLQCHSIFMYVNKLSVWGCGSHLRPHITEGEAWMQQSSSFLKAYHFPGWATRRWLSLGFNDFIFYHLRLRQFVATDWGEPCKRWVQHVPFRTLCNVRDQNNFSQGSLRSAMQGLKNPVLWPSQSLSEPWKPRWTLPLVHYKMLPYLPRSHDVPQGKI